MCIRDRHKNIISTAARMATHFSTSRSLAFGKTERKAFPSSLKRQTKTACRVMYGFVVHGQHCEQCREIERESLKLLWKDYHLLVKTWRAQNSEKVKASKCFLKVTLVVTWV